MIYECKKIVKLLKEKYPEKKIIKNNRLTTEIKGTFLDTISAKIRHLIHI
jgi:hypothetical protein